MPGRDEQGESPFEARYVPDDGFTARTLARLPGPRRAWRRWVLGAAVLLSLLVGAVLSPEVVELGGQVWRATVSPASSLVGHWSVMALVGVIGVGAVLALLRGEA
jgi:hypothetical protein